MEYEYDVALSFAGENREYVQQVAQELKENDIKVFYDDFEKVNLWGKDLGVHFAKVYGGGIARYCIPFISKHYEDKFWTKYEIHNALSKAIESKEEYILPARFDQTEISGIRKSISYINLNKLSPQEFAHLVINKLGKDIVKATSVLKESSNSDNLLFSEDSVIANLPRGYLLINGTEFKTFSSWAVTAHYYNYNGDWLHSTHYHESYHDRWEDLNGLENQCRKLHIQKGDWDIAKSALYLVMDLREREQHETVEDIVRDHSSKDEFYSYYPKNIPFQKPSLPDAFIKLNKSGDLRDIIYELQIILLSKKDLPTLHQNCEEHIRKAVLIVHKKFSNSHPITRFVNDVVDKYKHSYSLNELKKWIENFCSILLDACEHIS